MIGFLITNIASNTTKKSTQTGYWQTGETYTESKAEQVEFK